MKVKAVTGFSGDITMEPGEIREIGADRAKHLIRIGHCIEVKAEKAKKAVKPRENKSTNRHAN